MNSDVTTISDGLAHFGLCYPCDATLEELAELVEFFVGFGFAVEVIPGASDLSDKGWVKFRADFSRERFRECGLLIREQGEDPSADRAGAVRRFRFRKPYGSLCVSFARCPVTKASFQTILGRQMRGLHLALRFLPRDLPLLLDHPKRRNAKDGREAVPWGPGSRSVFLDGPFGYEVECQITEMNAEEEFAMGRKMNAEGDTRIHDDWPE